MELASVGNRTRRISGGFAVRFIRWFCERRKGDMTNDKQQMHHCIQCGKLLPVRGGCVVCTCGTTEVDFCVPSAEEQAARLNATVAALTTCERWLQQQVAERDSELVELRKTAAALMEIAASDADQKTRRRMLDRMAMESFTENG